MREKELFKLLQSLNLPVAYHHFNKPTSPPYIAYLSSEHQRGSDEQNLIVESSYIVELYTIKKDLALESKLDSLLSFVEFEKETIYIDSEKVYQTIYTFDITSKL